MSGIRIDWDLSEIEGWVEELRSKTQKDVDDLMEDAVKEIAARTLSKVVARTPVDTGYLRKAWTGGMDTDPTAYVYSNLDVTRESKDMYTIELHNFADYASYVELGHKTISGGWVEGVFMLKISIQEMESELPGILESKFIEWLGG